MSLNKGIDSGKERRKQYRDSRLFDVTCRNHGSCGWCEKNRTHNARKAEYASLEALRTYLNEGI